MTISVHFHAHRISVRLRNVRQMRFMWSRRFVSQPSMVSDSSDADEELNRETEAEEEAAVAAHTHTRARRTKRNSCGDNARMASGKQCFFPDSIPCRRIDQNRISSASNKNQFLI
jgi:hypothetical protein